MEQAATAPTIEQPSTADNIAHLEKRVSELKQSSLPFECPECHRRFKSKQALGSHRYGAHNIVGLTHGRDQHRARLEPDEQGLYHCPDCDRTFGSVSAVTLHRLRSHKGITVAARRSPGRPPKNGSPAPATVVTPKAPLLIPVDKLPNFCPCCGVGIRAMILAMVFPTANA